MIEPPFRKGTLALQRLVHLHDSVFSDLGRTRMKHLLVRLSIFALLAHLTLIFAVRSLPSFEPLAPFIGTNYLTAIATPFDFILFYEVLTLIAALPASTTRSIANQFEIVSLVFIRDVFRDLTVVSDPKWVMSKPSAMLPLAYDMLSGILMFLFATLFQYFAQKQVPIARAPQMNARKVVLTAQKKLLSVALTVLLLVLAVYHLSILAHGVWEACVVHAPVSLEPASSFYNDLFTVMIFTDIVMLVLALVLTGRYEMVFRNAAYVASIVVIRFSLTEERPFGALIALFAMAFGILTSIIFNFHSRLHAAEMQRLADEH